MAKYLFRIDDISEYMDYTNFNKLNSLDFKLANDDGKLTIDVPSYRATRDVAIPEDIVEEIGRIFGYDNIDPVPPYVPCDTPNRNELRLFERSILDILSRSHQMIEVSHHSFVGSGLLDRLGINEDKEIMLQNPLSNEQDRLRRSLLPNLIKSIQLNQKNFDEFRIFELGRVYLKDDRTSPELARENTFVSGVVFSNKEGALLLYDVKNIVMGLMEELHLKGIGYMPLQQNIPPFAHPGRSIDVVSAKKTQGILFELHPGIKEEFDIKGNAAFFDLNITNLFKSKRAGMDFVELRKFPDVPFEISVLVDKFVYTSDIYSVIQNSNKKYIKSVDVISIYEGSPIPEGQKSVSLRIVFASRDKTLSPEEIENLQNSVIENLKKKGYNLR